MTTFAQINSCPIGERREREGHVGRLVQVVGSPRPGRELAAAGSVIRLHQRVDDPCDRRALESGELHSWKRARSSSWASTTVDALWPNT